MRDLAYSLFFPVCIGILLFVLTPILSKVWARIGFPTPWGRSDAAAWTTFMRASAGAFIGEGLTRSALGTIPGAIAGLVLDWVARRKLPSGHVRGG